MPRNEQIAQRWADVCLGKETRNYAESSNVFARYDRIYSYGSHFELGRIVRDAKEKPLFWLLNGDRYSVSTSRHQNYVRNTVHGTNLPVIIAPFTALNSAGINLDSIRPLDIRPDTFESYETTNKLGNLVTHYRHWLGGALLSAKVGGRRRKFISGFDDNERQALYFLAELPRTSAKTYAEGIDALAPRAVHAALAQGRDVKRQGDIFAIPVTLPTREIRRRGESVKRGRIHGTDHNATEVVYGKGNVTYARGVMHHTRAWGRGDHARVKLDGWHLCLRNTVPRQRATRRRLNAATPN